MRGGCVSAIVLLLYSLHGSFAQAQNKSCPELAFNGAGNWKNDGSYYQLSCPHYYHLLGPSKLTCTNDQWSSADSICIGPRCSSTGMLAVENGRVKQEFKGKRITVECAEGFETHQSPYVVCIDSKWNSTLPMCFPKNPALTCNVDDEQDLCGWSQENDDLEEWLQQSSSTYRSQGYGPEKDHSKNGNGQYLYLDGIAEQNNNTGHFLAKIFSPIYKDSLSTSSCFSFWYHIFGDTAAGALRLYQHFIGPKGAQSSDPKLLVEIEGDQGDAWRKQVVNLTATNQSFQIVFEAESDRKLSTIIAIDDFNLGKDCTPFEKESVAYPSCKYRCVNESETAKNLSCSCSISTCKTNNNCCPDATKYCVASIKHGTQATTSSPVTAHTTPTASSMTKEESKILPPSKDLPEAGHSGLIITIFLLLALVAIVAVIVVKRKQLQNRYASLRSQRVSLLNNYDNPDNGFANL